MIPNGRFILNVRTKIIHWVQLRGRTASLADRCVCGVWWELRGWEELQSPEALQAAIGKGARMCKWCKHHPSWYSLMAVQAALNRLRRAR